jgi:hypothetical protein
MDNTMPADAGDQPYIITHQLQQSSDLHYAPEDRPKMSATIGKLATALAKAQGEIENASKDGKGNFGKYANLASTWDAIRGPLSKNEIAIYQRPLMIAGRLTMATMLMHSSGEFLDDSELEMIFDRSGGRVTPMQAMGSAVTYARRYTLQAATGVAPADDDDGQSAGKPQASGPLPQKSKPQPADPGPKTDKGPAAQKPKTNPNFAPAPQDLLDQINDLAIERQISENILIKLVRDGYECKTNPPLTWIAKEIAEMLSNEDCNEATLMAQFQRLASRKEAARIKAAAEGGQ